MMRHAFLVAFALVFLMPVLAHAQQDSDGDVYANEDSPTDPGEIIDGDGDSANTGKGGWRDKWQQQRGEIRERVKDELQSRYGGEAGEKAGAMSGQLRTKLQEEGSEYSTSAKRLDKWREMKGEAPRFVKEAMSEEDRKKRLAEWQAEHPDAPSDKEDMEHAWEEWKANHATTSDKMDETKQTLREKYEAFLATRTGNARNDQEKMRDFKFQNREEAVDALRKYNQWKDTPQAESVKAYVDKWKQMQGNAAH